MGILKFGSVCSGIEAASVAWEVLGWEAAWLAEIEPLPSAVLAHHWPNVANLGDMTKIAEWVKLGFVEAPDVLVGGTPCQAFSVAGVRNSLDDDRGQLTLEFIKIADELDAQRETPSIIVWENVPGVLNTKDNAFGCFLGELSGAGEELQPSGKKWTNAGYVSGPKRAVAWRVLDAQHFGVAQRRRRVFVVASARKDCNPAEVLFEPQGLRRDIAPSRSARQETAGSAGSCAKAASRWDSAANPHPTLNQSHNAGGVGSSNQEVFSQRGAYLVGNPHGFRMTAFGQYADDETASTMKQRDYKDATDLVVSDHATPKSNEEICFTLNARDFKGSPCINDVSVRRLTPIECERLQGFPDNHTKVPYRNKPAEDCPDGPRYAACGNSMAVPVMRWIGRRINEVLSNARAV